MQGQIADIPQIEHEIFDRKIYERFFPVEKGDIVMDIGAHVGVFVRSVVDRAKKVYAIEPDPMFCKELSKLRSKKVAVSELLAISYFSGTSTIKSDGNANVVGSGSEPIDTIRFIDYVNWMKIKHIDFLKIDCEGGEYSIFEDLDAMLWINDNCRKIACELHIHSDRHRTGIMRMIQSMEKGPFEWFITDLNGNKLELNYFLSRIYTYTETMLYAHKTKK